MITSKINSIKKVRLLVESESDIQVLSSYYHILENLLYHYKRVMNKAKEMEALQLLKKIKLTIIKQITIA